MLVEEKIHSTKGIGFWVKKIQISERSGSPTLVFLHNALGCSATWKNFPERICQKLRLNGLLDDRQGHGKSDSFNLRRPLNYLEQEAQEIVPLVLQHFRIEKKTLFGHSNGASIALLYESQFQDAAAIVSMSGHTKVEPITLRGISRIYKECDQSDFFEKLQRYHGGQTKKLINHWATTWLSNDFRHWNISDKITNINCPTLAIQGKDDEYATDEHLFEIATIIGQPATLVLLENCGYFPYKEKLEEVIELISQFLV